MLSLYVPTLLGVVILVVLCVTDFRSRVVRRASFLYGLSMGLFLVLNLGIYWVLVVVVSNADSFFLSGKPEKALTLLTPLVVAFLYFGAGASTFTFGRLRFSFYEKLVTTFATWFKCTIDPSEVRKAVAKGDYEHLKDALDQLHRDAEERSWNELPEEWLDICSDRERIEEHIKDLEETRGTLIAGPSLDALERQAERLGERVNDLREVLIRRHRSHLNRFIKMNAKSEDDVAQMLEAIPDAWDPPPKKPFKVTWLHAVAGGVFFGFLIGLVALGGGMAGVSGLTPVFAAISVSVFTGIFYFSLQSETFPAAGIIGGVAGFSGQLVWGVVAILSPESSSELSWQLVWQLAVRSILSGVLYGGATGVLLFLFRTALRERVHKLLTRALTVAGLGWVAFFLIAALVPLLSPSPHVEGSRILQWILMGVIGAILNLGLAYVCQLLRCHGAKHVANAAAAPT